MPPKILLLTLILVRMWYGKSTPEHVGRSVTIKGENKSFINTPNSNTLSTDSMFHIPDVQCSKGSTNLRN